MHSSPGKLALLVTAVLLFTASQGLAQSVESTAAVTQGSAPSVQVPSQANATDNNALAAKVQAIEEIVQKQQQVIEVQQRQIEELKNQGTKSTDSVAALEARWQKAEKEKKPEMPGWLEGLKFSGDLRIRYEGIWQDPRPANTTNDQRGRFRLRFGFEKKITDDFDIAFRLASGKDSDPTTTNQTFTDDFSKKPVWIDLAYGLYHPVAVPGLVLGAGKFKNPYVNTDMMWSQDVNPEGAYETYKFKVGKAEPFITLGQQMLTDNTNTVPDANLLAYQPGVKVNFTENVNWVSALAYYDFLNYAQKGNFAKANGNTVAPSGNLAAEEFNIWNFTNIVTFPVKGLPVSPYVDYAKNVGDEAIVDGEKQDTAYAIGVKIGDIRKKGDWVFDYKYARIEADSIVGGFGDNSFGPGSNAQGSKVGFAYGLAKNVTLGTALYFTEPVTGNDVDKTTVQADLVFKF